MSIINKLLRTNTLYYPGCLTKFALPEIQKNYEMILNSLGINFIKLRDIETCCGSPVLNSGYSKEFEKNANDTYNLFVKHGVKKIITNCPACYHIFKTEYPKIVKNWDIEVEHITQTIDKNISKIKSGEFEDITYHDPCHLGRKSKIYEEPRRILKRSGKKIVEMKLNKKDSFCCGGGGSIKSNFNKLSNSIAKERITQAEETGVNTIVTSCPMCYLNLKENSRKMKVKEFSEVVKHGT